jgi:hypothetical protein
MVRIAHCDHAGCTAEAICPKNGGTPDGWTNGANAHGCPAHAEAIAAHGANITSQTRGRGSQEKTTWFLTCACRWSPTPHYATYSSTWLREQHLKHVAEVTA